MLFLFGTVAALHVTQNFTPADIYLPLSQNKRLLVHFFGDIQAYNLNTSKSYHKL